MLLAWCHVCAILDLGRQRQEDHRFKVSDKAVRPCLKKLKIHNIARGKGCVFDTSGSMLDGANVLSVMYIQPSNHTSCSHVRFW